MAEGLLKSYQTLFERETLTSRVGDALTERRANVSAILKKWFDILDLFWLGSTVNGTAITSSDADILIALDRHHVHGRDSHSILLEISELLCRHGLRAQPDGRCVRVCYVSGPNVDVVPAYPLEGTRLYHIPDEGDDMWIFSDPIGHQMSMKALSHQKKSLIRLMKIWNVLHASPLTSYYIDILGITTSVGDENISSCIPAAAKEFFRYAERCLIMSLPHPTIGHPTLGGVPDVGIYLTDQNRDLAENLVSHAVVDLEHSYRSWLREDDRRACEYARNIFGCRFQET